ncbi:uncharacterized protein TRAVEDRAFT_22508 [Trametes versicolor FP-101664 SS1]|uniref:uncharacterized protein n=1 Tax=Trametes versicolor (strain FP-101664) TaxID=717944 RepID=UPI000462438D|nr:uncharacterized protein TRAVEDRAFT_22508 [Trametes versicolor FP-101664 SS1]EIW56187.1 hypothetical protein TRAVEDRAFT_22508 [Trametes versicolor FP-101664 SS1]
MARTTKSSNGSAPVKKTTTPAAPVQKIKTPTAPRCRYPGCGYASSRVHDLKRHFLTHLDRPGKYKCPFPGCSHTTKQKSNMKPHIAIHTGQRPDKCPHHWIDEFGVVSRCSAAFSDPSGLLRHRKRLHGYVVGSRAKLEPRFRSVADQEDDRDVNALALSLKLTVPAATKELKKRRMAGIYDVPAPPSASSPSPAYPSSMEPICEPVAGPSSSNFAQSMSPVKHERSLSPTLANLAADMGLELNSEDFDCSFDDEPQLAASNVDSWQLQQQQYQGQNFGNVMAPDFLLSGQDPGQYLNSSNDWSVAGAPGAACAPQPAMDWNMQNWAQSLVVPPLDPNMGLGMGVGMCAPNPMAYDTPALPSANSLYGQTSPSWNESYYDQFSSDSSSIASSPSANSMDYLDDFMRRTA